MVTKGVKSKNVNDDNTNEIYFDTRGGCLLGQKSLSGDKKAGWLAMLGEPRNNYQNSTSTSKFPNNSTHSTWASGLACRLIIQKRRTNLEKCVYFMSSLSSSRYCRPALGPVAPLRRQLQTNERPWVPISRCTLYIKIILSLHQLGLKVSHPFISVASSSPSRSTAELFTGLDACTDSC